MKKNFSGAYYLLSFISLGLYILGLVHAFKKHGVTDGILGVFLPPFTMYRGIESFWHNDYAGVNWDVEIKDKTETAIILLNAAYQDNNIIEAKERAENINKIINKYPDDKKTEIKENIKTYFDYVSSYRRDFITAIENTANNKKLDFNFSKKTVNLENTLKSKNIYNDDLQLKNGVKLEENKLNEILTDISEEDRQKIIIKINDDSLNFERRMLSIYAILTK